MPHIPVGTVTFLFTDLEGSTRLWEEHPDIMRDVLARHDDILRTMVESQNGYLVKTTGDGVHAAFATATDALNAALSAQLALIAEPWPDSLPIKVRMGIHTGAAEVRQGDYFGTAVNRAARIMAAGHGGQVLLSDATFELVRDTLPEGVTLLPLGEHRLKDLARPETLYQLAHPALPTTFPPLKTLDNPEMPNNLPRQLTSFVGREQEIEQVKQLLAKTSLLTITGSGGCGKTRLSLQVAADLLEDYPDGVWFVELAPLSDPTLVPQAVGQALGVKEQSGKTMAQTLVEHLQALRVLLLLDNCEHVVSACATLAATLLRSCPNVRILATSRERLGIAGELTYRVPSLAVPDPKQAATVESLSLFESVRLFIDRAVFHRPDFSVTNANAASLAQLCHRLDGIPLAIELAAARTRSLSVEEINNRLDSRFRLLTGGDRSALPRQQTLRALVDWSYDLLSDAEKTLLSRLSVFAGGWRLEAAEKVCGFDPIEDWEILDLLTSLLDKSLVNAEETSGATRYRMLETIRQYGAEKLSAEERETLGARHAGHFLGWMEEVAPRLRGPEQGQWMNRVGYEYENVRVALDRFTRGAKTGDIDAAERGLGLAKACEPYWLVRGPLSEARERLSVLLEALGEHPSLVVAEGWRSLAELARSQGDFPLALAAYDRSLTLCRPLEDRLGIARALAGKGQTADFQGDYASAQDLLEEALRIFRELGGTPGIASTLNSLGNVCYGLGDYEGARSRFMEALTLHREMGHDRFIGGTLGNLGHVASAQGDYAAASAYFEEALPILRRIGDRNFLANGLSNLASVGMEQGDFASARTLLEEALSLKREIGDRRGVAASLGNLGTLLLYLGDAVSALPLVTEAITTHREQGDKPFLAIHLAILGEIYLALGKYETADTLFGEGMVTAREIGNRDSLSCHLAGSGRAALAEGKYALARSRFVEALSLRRSLSNPRPIEESLRDIGKLMWCERGNRSAVVLWGAAETVRASQGIVRYPRDAAEQTQLEEAARSALGDAVFDSAFAEGCAMTMEQAIEYALKDAPGADTLSGAQST